MPRQSRATRSHLQATRRAALLLATSAVAASTLPATADFSFRGLGDLPGGNFESQAFALSSDGTTVVGQSRSATFPLEGFVWTDPLRGGSGMTGLTALNPVTSGLPLSSQAFALAPDASVAGGSSFRGSSVREATLWFQPTLGAAGIAGLGDLPGGLTGSSVQGIATNGDRAVGNANSLSGGEAFSWTRSGGMVGLGDVPGGNFFSNAFDITPDGQTIVGLASPDLNQTAARYTDDAGWELLGRPARSSGSLATAVAHDGNTIVGYGTGGPNGFQQGFRWTPDTGLTLLGDLLPDNPRNFNLPHDLSADGSTIVGSLLAPGPNFNTAYLWTDPTQTQPNGQPGQGLQTVRDVLTDLGLAPALNGWVLEQARGISADGTVITGTGTNPNGQTEAWIATIPEPAAATLLLAATTPLLRRRRHA